MIYHVRFQYGMNVEASTSAEAYRKSKTLIKENPDVALRGVESREHRPLWKMLLFGY